MKTDTPETDAIQGNGIHQVTDAFDHARKLERERNEALELLKTVHEWFMQKAPEHYNGCGLWIDVDMKIRDWQNAEAIRPAGETTPTNQPMSKPTNLPEPQKAGRMRRLVLCLWSRPICFVFGCKGGWYLPCKRCGEPISPNY